jgi:diacylglycerol kinase (ATP)
LTDPAAGPASAWAGRTLIILNPYAGKEDLTRMRRRLGGAFAARGASFDLIPTEYAGHATRLARTAVTRGYRAVAVCGGDGTLAEAATGLAGSEVPLAILPRGTANQVAQNLGVPLNFEAAVDVAVSGVPALIDLGLIDGRAFALVAGAGFDAAVMQSATRELKERFGFGAYVYAAMKEALAASPRLFHIRADDRELDVEAVSVMVANVGELFPRWLPLRFSLVPQPVNAWRDGLLDVVIVAPRKMPDLAMMLWHAATATHVSGSDRLIHFQTREITITATPPIAVQVDGDPYGTTPVSMSVMRDAMHVLLPAPL